MGTQHTYRVIVRGTWDGLADGARERLLAEADEHGLASMRFTSEGSLTYDRVLKHFSYRFVVESDAEDGEEMAEALAEERAEAALQGARRGLRLRGAEVVGDGHGHDEGQPEAPGISAVSAQRSWSRQAPSMKMKSGE